MVVPPVRLADLVERQKGRSEVANAGEHTVQLGLVGGPQREGGGGVAVVGQDMSAEPLRPVIIQVSGELDLVAEGFPGGPVARLEAWGRGHGDAPQAEM